MIILIYVLFIIIGILERRNGKISIIMLLYILLVGTINVDKPDFQIYSVVYNAIGEGSRITSQGIGWYYLCCIGNALKLTYSGFNFLIIGCSLFLIYLYLSSITKQKEFAIALYMLYPMMYDLCQVRFFVASSVVVYATKYLKEKKKTNIVKYIGLVILSSTIHKSSIIYILLGASFFEFNKKKIKIKGKIFLFIVLFGVIYGSPLYIRPVLKSLAGLLINDNRIDIYFNGSISFPAYVCYSMLYIIPIVLLYMLSIYSHKRNDEEYNFIMNLNLMIFLTLPIISFDNDFLRVQRIMWILNSPYIANLIKEIHDSSKKVVSKILVVGYYFLGFSAFILYLDYQTVFKSLISFENIPKLK